MPKRLSRPEDRRAGFSGFEFGRWVAVVLAGLLLALAAVSLVALVAPELGATAKAQPRQQEPDPAAGLRFGSGTAGEVYTLPLPGSGIEITVKGESSVSELSSTSTIPLAPGGRASARSGERETWRATRGSPGATAGPA